VGQPAAEAGLLAIFFARRSCGRARPGSAAAPLLLWLLRWLLFRLLFGSGVAKLLSGDPTWRDLTALRYHYETQPLPTWTSWYMHQLPEWFQALSVLFSFAAELLRAAGFFGPRRWRRWPAPVTVALQLLIAATGNFRLLQPADGSCCACRSWTTIAFRRAGGSLGCGRARDRGWPRCLLWPLAAGSLSSAVLLVFSRAAPGTRASWLTQASRAGPVVSVR